MLKRYFKIVNVIFAIIFLFMVLFACSNKNNSIQNVSAEKPFMDKMTGEYNLDFVAAHNFIIDSLQSQYTPFFFVKEGKFDVSGDNTKKSIEVKCTCMDGTTIEDVDLFISMVLNLLSYNLSEQDFRFRAPKVDKSGTYLDFGNVFDVFALKVYADTENGTILRNETIKPGGKMPVDSRYWSE